MHCDQHLVTMTQEKTTAVIEVEFTHPINNDLYRVTLYTDPVLLPKGLIKPYYEIVINNKTTDASRLLWNIPQHPTKAHKFFFKVT